MISLASGASSAAGGPITAAGQLWTRFGPKILNKLGGHRNTEDLVSGVSFPGYDDQGNPIEEDTDMNISLSDAVASTGKIGGAGTWETIVKNLPAISLGGVTIGGNKGSGSGRSSGGSSGSGGSGDTKSFLDQWMPLLLLGTQLGTQLYQANSLGNASEKAAQLQSASADKAIALQERMYNQSRADLEPNRKVGQAALFSLAEGVGLPRSATGAPDSQPAFNIPGGMPKLAPPSALPSQRFNEIADMYKARAGGR